MSRIKYELKNRAVLFAVVSEHGELWNVYRLEKDANQAAIEATKLKRQSVGRIIRHGVIVVGVEQIISGPMVTNAEEPTQ